MWAGRVRTIHATEHLADLEEGARPVRFMPYRRYLAIRLLIKAEIIKKLEAGVIKQTTSK